MHFNEFLQKSKISLFCVDANPIDKYGKLLMINKFQTILITLFFLLEEKDKFRIKDEFINTVWPDEGMGDESDTKREKLIIAK